MSGWTVLRTHTRADGAVARIERSAAGRWQVSTRRGAEALDKPTQWEPQRFTPELARAVVATFAQRCIQPLVLRPDLLAELEAAADAAAPTPALKAVADELRRGRPKALALAVDGLAAGQPDPAKRAALEAVAKRIWQARAEALAALPPEVTAPLEAPAGAEVRRG